MNIRPAVPDDIEAITEIYGHHVLNGFGTFEEIPPDQAEMATRMAGVEAYGLPYLVADDGHVLGYAYAAPFRTRAAYRFTVEDSIYVSAGQVGRGVGKALLGRVIEICRDKGLRQMMAVIGDSDNAASIGLHKFMGFEHTGLSPAVGFKFGRWVDVVWMQLALTAGSATKMSPVG